MSSNYSNGTLGFIKYAKPINKNNYVKSDTYHSAVENEKEICMVKNYFEGHNIVYLLREWIEQNYWNYNNQKTNECH